MRNDDLEKSKLFTRRAFLLLTGQISLMSLLTARLYHLQIFKTDEYKTLSENNHIKLVLIPPIRGNIIDRLGNPLAVNQKHYRALLTKNKNKNHKEIIQKISNILDISANDQDLLLKKIRQSKLNTQIMVKDMLSWQEVSSLEVNYYDLPDILVDTGQKRYYPFADMCSHLVGYVGSVSEEKLSEKQLFSHPDFKVGKNGIEKVFEDKLRGKTGVKKVEVNAYGSLVREISREESLQGEEVMLTIDMRLQEYIFEKLDKRSGTVIMLDLANGDVLSFVSSPSYNPNIFTKGISKAYWDELISSEDHPLVNKVISTTYPPGSVFKSVVALAALKNGVNPLETIFCNGQVLLGKRAFHCWKKTGHGIVDMNRALAESCNCYFYNLTKKIDIDMLASIGKLFGMGEVVGLELLGEHKGIMPSRKWKKEVLNQEWHAGDMFNTVIGQGFTSSTPLQLVTLVSRVATGKMVTPRLTFNKNSGKIAEDFKDLDISEAHFNIVRKGMEMVVNSNRGTAFGGRIIQENFLVAGKTGTSQVISKKTMSELSKVNRTHQHHGLFTGYAPIDEPRFACCVILEHAGSGSFAAALACDILSKAGKLNDIHPV